ncbi:hypothetical protein CEXT_115391 [Caerostris extrusa]|uniref:MADF domain-containing protein n=1 Tax=Caerostris extrusa TaxID=172846 RepID=A0AAV4MRC9_CAEEX|nr:hypothetical protein CEXT_115391 [Caerostris extrusa]
MRRVTTLDQSICRRYQLEDRKNRIRIWKKIKEQFATGKDDTSSFYCSSSGVKYVLSVSKIEQRRTLCAFIAE